MTRTKTRATTPAKPTVRCAIYTRKSTEDGLQQEFNSLDAQRDAGENYIRSQEGEGWQIIPDQYDDGGFTGGNMDRPALKRLMADIDAGKVDCTVKEGSPKKEIVESAIEFGADRILIGAQGHGTCAHNLLGEVSRVVAATAHCSVEIIRETVRL